ncbi:MAG: MarR family transcriptional regulator [Acidobacteriota bacterium]|nr:MarR family transcriptional regulator [Acidobacteriota bacterium]
MQLKGEVDRDLIEALQIATRDLLAVALQSLDRVSGIKLQHMRLLIAVHENPGAASVVIAESLGLSPSSVTRQADRLCDAGYLTRDQPAGNRRMVVLTLTPQGEQIVAAVLGYRAEVFGNAIPALDPAVRASLASGLSELHQALRGDGAGTPSRSLES